MRKNSRAFIAYFYKSQLNCQLHQCNSRFWSKTVVHAIGATVKDIPRREGQSLLSFGNLGKTFALTTVLTVTRMNALFPFRKYQVIL